MIKFLLKTTEEYRLETLEDVKSFHEQLKNDEIEQGYHLASFSWTEKDVKEQGEVVDSYYIVKAKKLFQEAKNAMVVLNKIDYDQNVPSITN